MLRVQNANDSDLVASQLLDVVEAAWDSIAEEEGKTTLIKASEESEESESEDDDEEGKDDSKVDDLSDWAQAEFESVVESFHAFLDCGGGGRVEIRRRTAALRSKMMLRTRRKEEEEI